jgi:hypothetical protein
MESNGFAAVNTLSPTFARFESASSRHSAGNRSVSGNFNRQVSVASSVVTTAAVALCRLENVITADFAPLGTTVVDVTSNPEREIRTPEPFVCFP